MKTLIQEFQYPHWMMIVGALLVLIGFIGHALRRNAEPSSAGGRKGNQQPEMLQGKLKANDLNSS